MRGFFRLLALVAILVGIASFYNVYSDAPGLDAKAHAAACAGRGAKCAARMSKQARLPWKRAYVYAGSDGGQVDCTRAWLFFGAWSCARAAAVSY